MGHAPVVDGEEGFLPKTPHELREEGNFAKVPLMSGITTEDGSFYTGGFIPEAHEGGFNRSTFLDILKNRLIDNFAPQFPEKFEDVFQAMSFFYTPWPYIEDKELNREKFNEMITDVGFGYSEDLVMKHHSEFGSDTYHYLLGYRSKNAAELVPEWMGVPHMGDLPYVWGWPLLQLNPDVRENQGILLDIIEWDEEDIEYTDLIQTLWLNFAKTGNPTPEPVPTPGDNPDLTWKPFTKDEQNYVLIKKEITQEVNYRQRNFAFWTKYMTYVSGGIEVRNTGMDTLLDADNLNSQDVYSLVDEYISDHMTDKVIKTKRWNV